MAVFGNILDRIAKKKLDLQRADTEKRRVDEMVRANKEETARREKESFLKPVTEQRARDAETYSLPGVMGLAKGAETEFRAKRREGRSVAKEGRTQSAFDRTQRVSDNAENLSRIKRAQLAGIPLDDVELVGGPSLQEKLRLAAQAKQLTSQQVLDNKIKAAELQLRFQGTRRPKRQIREQAKVDQKTKESWAADPKTMVTIEGSGSKKTGGRGRVPGPKYDSLWRYPTPKGKRLNKDYLQGVLTTAGAYAALEGHHGNVINAQRRLYELRRDYKKANKEQKKKLLVEISKANADLAVARNGKQQFLSTYVKGAGGKAYSQGERPPQAFEEKHKDNATALKNMELSSPPKSDSVTATQALRALSKEAKIRARNSDAGRKIQTEIKNLEKKLKEAVKGFKSGEVSRLGQERIKLNAAMRALVKEHQEKLRVVFMRNGGSFVK